jgi:hypothetical protein
MEAAWGNASRGQPDGEPGELQLYAADLLFDHPFAEPPAGLPLAEGALALIEPPPVLHQCGPDPSQRRLVVELRQ